MQHKVCSRQQHRSIPVLCRDKSCRQQRVYEKTFGQGSIHHSLQCLDKRLSLFFYFTYQTIMCKGLPINCVYKIQTVTCNQIYYLNYVLIWCVHMIVYAGNNHTLFFFSSDDTVYMEKKEEREEYVLNETGRIWTQRGYFGRPWNFGQARFIFIPSQEKTRMISPIILRHICLHLFHSFRKKGEIYLSSCRNFRYLGRLKSNKLTFWFSSVVVR